MIDQLSSLVNINTLQILEKIDEKSVSLNEISKHLGNTIENLDDTTQSLLKYGWLKEKNSKFDLSRNGKQKLILLRVIFEQDSTDSLYDIFKMQVWERFRLLQRESLTDNFFVEIENNKPDEIDSVFICSPWVGLKPEQLDILLNLKQAGVGIFIIIRPIEGQKENTLNTHNFFIKNNFNLYYYKVRSLHTKLYLIKKNDYNDVAIFGSENLTNQNNEELGMIIRDEDFVEKLEDYLLELTGNSKKARSN